MRRGEPHALFDHLCDAGLPHTVVEIAREGFRKTGDVLCPFVALLAPLALKEPRVVVDDELPPEAMIGGVPGWAYDLYSREGRAALARFLEGSSATACWVRSHVPPPKRIDFLGSLVFRVEGGLCRSRLRWRAGDRLRLADLGSHGSGILEILRDDLPVLNEARAVLCR
jgi:hypothetical protein